MSNQRVTLETAADKDTGFVLNVYQWHAGTELKIQVEVANRIFVSDGAVRAEPYDQAIDGRIAEARRAMIECALERKDSFWDASLGEPIRPSAQRAATLGEL